MTFSYLWCGGSCMNSYNMYISVAKHGQDPYSFTWLAWHIHLIGQFQPGDVSQYSQHSIQSYRTISNPNQTNFSLDERQGWTCLRDNKSKENYSNQQCWDVCRTDTGSSIYCPRLHMNEFSSPRFPQLYTSPWEITLNGSAHFVSPHYEGFLHTYFVHSFNHIERSTVFLFDNPIRDTLQHAACRKKHAN